MLLGLDEPEDLEKEKQKEKKKKKSLLLQAEGQRKSGKHDLESFAPPKKIVLICDGVLQHRLDRSRQYEEGRSRLPTLRDLRSKGESLSSF